jgi:hypothetical protein
MISLRIELDSHPAGREDLGAFSTELEISYTRETGTIEDAWWLQIRFEAGNHYRTVRKPVHVDLAWSLLGGKSVRVTEYLDRLADEATQRRAIYCPGGCGATAEDDCSCWQQDERVRL